MSQTPGLSSYNGSCRGSPPPQCARCSSWSSPHWRHLMTPGLIWDISRILQSYIALIRLKCNFVIRNYLRKSGCLAHMLPQCAALSRVMSSVSQRGPCNLFSLLRSRIIIVVCIMFIIISIIVRGIYVMFMIIVYRLKPGSFCRLRAYGSLVFVWAAARLASQYCFPTLKCECEI